MWDARWRVFWLRSQLSCESVWHCVPDYRRRQPAAWLASKAEGTKWVFDIPTLLSDPSRHEGVVTSSNISDWLNKARPDAVFETTSLNPESGQPATDYLRAVWNPVRMRSRANKVRWFMAITN